MKKRVQIDLLPWMTVFMLSFFIPLCITWILIFVVVCNMVMRVIEKVRNEIDPYKD